MTADVSDPEQCDRAVAAAVSELGQLDILVNNAGIGTAYPATRETPEQFRQVIDINLNGAYWAAQCAGRVMQPGSSIVNISSVLGITTAGLLQAAYAASKAGLIGRPAISRSSGAAQGHPGQRDRAGLFRQRDDRPVRP